MYYYLLLLLHVLNEHNHLIKWKILIYYINTNELPGELSQKNIFMCKNKMLSSQEEITVAMVTQ